MLEGEAARGHIGHSPNTQQPLQAATIDRVKGGLSIWRQSNQTWPCINWEAILSAETVSESTIKFPLSTCCLVTSEYEQALKHTYQSHRTGHCIHGDSCMTVYWREQSNFLLCRKHWRHTMTSLSFTEGVYGNVECRNKECINHYFPWSAPPLQHTSHIANTHTHHILYKHTCTHVHTHSDTSLSLNTMI